ncbi:MAG: hypothetical protein O7F76_06670, partial [Planctomycetota bacterium]|nr:hypothetical protein [Planctomycetota bacterium]
MTNAPARLWLLLSIVAMPALAAAGDPVPRTDSEAADEEAYAFRFMFTPARTIYYVIENDYSDGAAISAQIPLAYNDSVIERRTYIQETQTPTTRDSGKSAKNLVGPVQWICDRYEVRQQGSFREDAAFDSLRNTYPVAALRGLSKVHGSKIIFMMDPATAKPASVQTRPGSTVAPTTSDRLSSTAQKCLVSGSNAERMLNDMGTLYFPDGPKRVGETWTLTHRTNHKSFGTTITKLDCTLRSVRDVDGSQIATIDLHGQIKMATAPGLSAPPASAAEKGTDQKAQVANVTATTHPTTHPTTQPTTAPVSKTRGRQVARDKRPPRTAPARLAKKDEKRRLERAVCTGSVEFDLSHGEVVRMNIHREIALVKTLSGGKSDKTPVQ